MTPACIYVYVYVCRYLQNGRLVLFPQANLPHKFWRAFKIGDIVDVKDIYGKWYEADVMKMDPASNRMVVHYHGWNSRST